MIFLIVLTRLYLGVHFLADILGGLVLGGVMLFLAWRIWGREWTMERLFSGKFANRLLSPHMLVLFYLPLVLLFLQLLSPAMAGYYLGVNTAYLLTARRGLSAEGGTLQRRLLRVLIAGLLFLLCKMGGEALVGLVPGVVNAYFARFLSAWLGTAPSFLLAFYLMKRFGLYEKKEMNGSR